MAKYVEKVFTVQLKNNKNYKEGKYAEALVETFKRIDEMVSSKEGEEELKVIRKKNDGTSTG